MEFLKPYFSKKILKLTIALILLAVLFWVFYITYHVNPRIDKFFYGTRADRLDISVELKKLEPFYIRPLAKIITFADSATFCEGIEIIQKVDTTLLTDAVTINKIWLTHTTTAHKTVLINKLTEASSHPNSNIRISAAKSLSEIGDTSSFNTLVALLKDENKLVQVTAINALAKLGDKRAITFLINKYNNHNIRNDELDLANLEALKIFNETSVAESILEEAKSANSKILLTAANIIAPTNKKLNLNTLYEHLYKTHGSIPQELIEPLTKIDKKNTANYYYDIRRIGIRKSYDAKQEMTFVVSSAILGHSSNTRIANYLVNFCTSTNTIIAQSAIQAVGKIGGDNVTKALEKLLNYKNEYIQVAAIKALAATKDTNYVNSIVRLTNSEKENVKNAAFHALAQIGGTTSINFLIQILETQHAKNNIVAAQALGIIGDSSACKSLIKKLDYYYEDVVRACIIALGQIEDRSAIEPIFEIFKNNNSSNLTAVAAVTLGKLGDNRVIHECKKLLLNGSVNYQEQAFEALLSIGNEKVMKELTHSLREKYLAEKKKSIIADIINTIKTKSL